MKLTHTLIAALATSITVLGCGAPNDVDPDENVAALNQACDGYGGVSAPVTIKKFDKKKLKLTGVTTNGRRIEFQVDRTVVFGEPPDPIGPNGKCGRVAGEWNNVLNQDGDDDMKSARIVDKLLPKLAKYGCTADISWFDFGGGNELLKMSFPLSKAGQTPVK